MPEQKITSRNQNFLINWIRGLCSILVVLGHARALGWYSSSGTYMPEHLLGKVLLIPSTFAVEAVAIFFVISGYLVGGKTLSNCRNRNFSWRDFLVDRISRLWIVLLPGLLFSWVTFIAKSSDLSRIIEKQNNFKSFACNLFFLMPERCVPFAGNSSLWSLGYEFYFYVIFAAFSNVVFFRKSLRSIGVNFFLMFLCIMLFSPAIFILFPAWLLGVLARIFLDSNRSTLVKIKIHIVTGRFLILFLPMFFVPNIFAFSNNITILFSSIPSFALLIFSLLKFNGLAHSNKILPNILDFLGNISFSLYVFHLPIVLFLYKEFEIFKSLPVQISVYLVATLTVVMSLPAYFLFERNTQKLRLMLKA